MTKSPAAGGACSAGSGRLQFVFKCLNALGATYLCDLLLAYQLFWILKSSGDGLLICHHNCRHRVWPLMPPACLPRHSSPRPQTPRGSGRSRTLPPRPGGRQGGKVPRLVHVLQLVLRQPERQPLRRRRPARGRSSNRHHEATRRRSRDA